jgi:hypothetical protein
MTTPFQEYVTDNAERVAMIRTAIAEIVKDGLPISIAAVTERVPKNFKLDPDLDFLSDLAAAEIGTTAKMAAKDNPDGAAVESADTLREKGRALDLETSAIRSELYGLRNQLQLAKKKLGDCIHAFTSGFGPRVSQAENVRNELAASLAERAANARGENLPPATNPGPSVLDRSAHFQGSQSGHHDASDFVRKGFTGGGFRRNAYPQSRQNAATRLKIPSAR